WPSCCCCRAASCRRRSGRAPCLAALDAQRRLERAKEAAVTTIGILHPGEMGSSVAAAARAGGSRVIWASAGRGEATRRRAAADGGIIGPPARKAGDTRLYLSGAGAADVAARFKGSLLEAIVLDGPVGAASAIKMAYAGWNKGSQALLLAIRALAAHEGVDAA